MIVFVLVYFAYVFVSFSVKKKDDWNLLGRVSAHRPPSGLTPVVFRFIPSSRQLLMASFSWSHSALLPFRFVSFRFDTVCNRLDWRRLEARRCAEEEQLGRVDWSINNRAWFVPGAVMHFLRISTTLPWIVRISLVLDAASEEILMRMGGVRFVLFFPSHSFVKANNIVERN